MARRAYFPRDWTPAQRLEHRSVTDASGCRVWCGLKIWNGYGVLTLKSKPYFVHRLAWEIENGPIPNGLFVCHHCDNRACINLRHLFLGTNAENMADMSRKERQGQAKLNAEAVLEIRASSDTQRSLAKKFGVAASAISRIRSGKLWRHTAIHTQGV